MIDALERFALRLIKARAARLEATNQRRAAAPATPDPRVVQCLRRMAEEQLQLAPAAPQPAAEIFVPREPADSAERVGLELAEVTAVIDRPRAAHLVLLAEDVGAQGTGFVVPEVGRLWSSSSC
jgi:hypothetical protein